MTSGAQPVFLDQRPPEFAEAVYQLHRALWALATDEGDNAQATLAEMTRYARLVRQLLEARERVRRASTVRVARPAPAPARERSCGGASPGRRQAARRRDPRPTARRGRDW